MRSKLQHFAQDESGVVALEVGLIAAGICVALITLAGQTNVDVKDLFEHLGDLLRSLNLHSLS